MVDARNFRRELTGTSACLDLRTWRVPTPEELRTHFALPDYPGAGKKQRSRPSALVVRNRLAPVDVFCYLKARFGEPNGFQNFLRSDSSDNWIHWDFALKANKEDIWICGTSREIHFAIWTPMTDENWRDLVLSIKADYKRFAKEKSSVLKSLEQWVIFLTNLLRLRESAARCTPISHEACGAVQTLRPPR